MKSNPRISKYATLLLLLTFVGGCAEKVTKVVCIGDSITYGAKLYEGLSHFSNPI